MKLGGMIFDLDGTLADTMSVCLQAFQETLEYYGGNCISLDELFPMFGPNEEGILRKLLPDNCPRHFYITCPPMNDCIKPVKQLFPGIEELLDVLSNHRYSHSNRNWQVS